MKIINILDTLRRGITTPASRLKYISFIILFSAGLFLSSCSVGLRTRGDDRYGNRYDRYDNNRNNRYYNRHDGYNNMYDGYNYRYDKNKKDRHYRRWQREQRHNHNGNFYYNRTDRY